MRAEIAAVAGAPTGRNAEAVERMLHALYESEVLDEHDDALVELARTLAVAVDLNPASAPLAKEYRSALLALRELAAPSFDRETAEFMRSIQQPGPRPDGLDGRW